VCASILIVTKAEQVYSGTQGLYVAGAIAGTTDVDAVTLSTAKRAANADTAAVITIVIAAISNTLVKSSLALGIGGAALGRRAFVIGGLIITGAVAGTAAMLALN